MATKANLSRAGKVSNSTPKVEKTEKPRKLTGRAATRERYEKREANGYFTGRMKMNSQGEF